MQEKQFYKITSAITQYIEYIVQQKEEKENIYDNKSQRAGSYDTFEYEKSRQRAVTGNAKAVNRP